MEIVLSHVGGPADAAVPGGYNINGVYGLPVIFPKMLKKKGCPLRGALHVEGREEYLAINVMEKEYFHLSNPSSIYNPL
jgi:hypothetical protein